MQGRVIAAIPDQSIRPGQQFALYPSNIPISSLPIEQYYRSDFLPIAKSVFASLGSETVLIKAWARCEYKEYLYNDEFFDALSRLTVWTSEALQERLSQRQQIFLTYLRVYLLPQPIEVPVHNQERQFVPLPHSLSVTESLPVLSDRIFMQRRRQLENLEPPLHPELEELESAIAQLSITNPDAEKFNHKIQTFLGWANERSVKQITPDLAWIHQINALGTASTGGNYEKGTAFEQIVHKSLAFLGFGVDPNAKGGAGGMDLYCTKPYPLVGECKAGQSIPGNTVYELDKLGNIHLGKKIFDRAVKLIIGPGKPTSQLQKSAKEYNISIIHPMTLQKLVELEAQYPGSVNLIELKKYLEPGQSDSRIDEYIQRIESDIKLRSHIIQLVKNYLENTGFERASVDALHGAYSNPRPHQPLQPEELHEILIELSSPLTGYLGRIKGEHWRRDRFFFLRYLD